MKAREAVALAAAVIFAGGTSAWAVASSQPEVDLPPAPTLSTRDSSSKATTSSSSSSSSRTTEAETAEPPVEQPPVEEPPVEEPPVEQPQPTTTEAPVAPEQTVEEPQGGGDGIPDTGVAPVE